MAQLVGRDDIESLRMELAELGRSMRSSAMGSRGSSLRRNHSNLSSSTGTVGAVGHELEDDEIQLQWAAIERLPTMQRIRSSLFFDAGAAAREEGGKGKPQVMDVTRLGDEERHMFIDKVIQHIENDNRRLLQKMRQRVDKVGVKLPSVEVRYQNLSVEAVCEVVHGKPLPTLWNSARRLVSGIMKLPGSRNEAKINIIKDISGIIKHSRLTLLLGPPGCGKTTFLLALAGKLNSSSLKVTGEISYNGFKLEEFVPQKTSSYISQNDLHIPEMTVREILDFSARCQGVGSRAEIISEVSRREKEAGIIPDPEVDTYMKATSVQGLERHLQTDYILKILGLDICADVVVGDSFRRGISGGQKKRLSTGEIIVSPTKTLFMDEISTGLDSSTTFQIVSCLQQFVHITDATALISLLQPAPETYDLFDDIILMAEGKIVYHGPREGVLKCFEDCGFKCPERKGAADFLQEVISQKDQAQYWCRTDEPYNYISVDQFSNKFKMSSPGKQLHEELSISYDKSQSHKRALSFFTFSLPQMELLKACMTRELLLMKRNSFVYIFKLTQLIIIASITMTVFLRTRMHVDLASSNYYLGSLFFAIIILFFDGFPEMSMTVSRLPVFFKQRDLYFYPAWAYTVPASILKIPISLLQSFVWTALTYYVIGYSPEAHRFFRHFLLLFGQHQMASSLFRFSAGVFRTMAASTMGGSLLMMVVIVFGGFVLPRPSMPSWLEWGFWASPFSYSEIGITVNEFLAPRWQKISPVNTTIGHRTLVSRGLDFDEYFYWISVGALLGFTVLFNVGFTVALTFLNAPNASRAIISSDKLPELQGEGNTSNVYLQKQSFSEYSNAEKIPKTSGRMILPFQPLSIAFLDVQYYIDTPQEMKEQGFTEKTIQLLKDMTGAFKPGVLTALMGVSGAGKTTLMDVLFGRKTGGIIEGLITIGGYPKVQETFARISGYCEQTDIHSPQITVEESVTYSAWLRLPAEVDKKTKYEFVNEVVQTIELDKIKDMLVGIPGVSGLSTEQRKRLTIAVELVANPSIIFMDEPTSGLDARAAAIVMRAVKNVVNTGRTVVCTIHQPSIDIFESFDELFLLKRGGRVIYSGPLGHHSNNVIKYFERVPGVPKIKDNYNPATWMLEVTSTSVEAKHGMDFANIYKESSLYEDNQDMAKRLSTPPSDSEDLIFSSPYPQNGWGQFKACLWKQHLSYWRSPAYNLVRLSYLVLSSFIIGALFWKHGQEINNQQDLFNVFGALYVAVLFLGVNNCSTVLPYIATERTVLYRERFAGMYSPWSFSFAQVAIEIPYSLLQTVLFVVVTYTSINFEQSSYKIIWYSYAILVTLLYYNYLGMLLISLTPTIQVASILSSAVYTLLNLFSGYLIPQPKFPKWWVWLYWICPTSWTLRGLIASQFGDMEKEITVFGETKSVKLFLDDYFGFRRDQLGYVAVVLAVFPLVFASIFAYCIGKLNFQRR